MAKYTLGKNYTKRWKFFRKIWFIIVLIIFLLVVIPLIVFIDSLFFSEGPETFGEASKASFSTVSPSIEIFTTPYFQFQTDSNWVFIPKESTNNKFVYKRIINSLTEALIMVYVDTPPDDVEATRLLPISKKSDSLAFEVGEVTDHCGELQPEEGKVEGGKRSIVLEDITMLCDVGGNYFTVVVGEIGESTTMEFIRPGGSISTYNVRYIDTRFNAFPSEFENIMSTFQLR